MAESVGTHYGAWAGKRATRTAGFPIDPFHGQSFYNTTDDIYYRYDSVSGTWYGAAFTTTTSTSTSTTTTSTSTTTTSTSTSTSTTTSTSTSTSTTTTI